MNTLAVILNNFITIVLNKFKFSNTVLNSYFENSFAILNQAICIYVYKK